MNTETQLSFNWLRKIPGELFKLDEKPLLGFPPAFPWDKFSTELNNALQMGDLSVIPGKIEWRSATDLFSGLGDNVKGIPLSVAPVSGGVWWVMPEMAVKKIINLLTAKDSQGLTEDVIDEDFFNAFFNFLAVEAIGAFDKIGYDKKLNVTINRGSGLPTEPCLGIDIGIRINDETIYGRLLLSPAFKKAWAQRYVQQQQKLALESPIADSLDVMIHLEAGKIDLLPSEWKQLAIGDYVLLDSCSLDPDEEKGRVMLVINGTPCFRAKIKQGSLKILEHPLYHEVDKMPTPSKKDDKGPPKDEDEDLDFDDEDEDDHDKENPADVASKDDDEIDFDDEDDIEKTANVKPAAKAPEKAPAAAPSAEKKAAAPTAPKTPASSTPLAVDDIPLPVVIEVGRIQMSVKKLLELQPGNMLELDIHPEAGVDMVVNGKRIARGELLRIGDAFGLRITELS